MRRRALRRLAGGCIASTSLLQGRAFAATFMDIEQARRLLLPAAETFAPAAIKLDGALLAELAALSQTAPPRGYAPQGWTGSAPSGRIGWVLFDRVIGKYDLIDFAMGFLADGSASGLEILAYRESHGAEVRNAAWRKQFVGRSGAAQMRFGDDVRNISGATLSCQHVTEGAQRLSVLAQWLIQARFKD